MRKQWQKKIITCVTALAMTVTIFPQSWLLKSEKAKAATREPDIITDLIGYYTFDGSLANKASVTGGKAILHGGAGDTWNQSATGTANYENSKNGFGKAYHFLGDGNTRGEGLQLDAKVTGTDFTISFWVNPEDYGVATTSLVFANHDDSCFTINSLNDFRCSALLGKLWDWNNRGNNFVCLDGDNTENGKASVGNWTMVTITNKNGEQKLYFDGVEKTQGNNSSQNALVTEVLKNQEIFLGINYWDASFKGLMDEVRIYDRALTAEDIAKLYTYTPSDDSYENRSNQRVTVHDPSIIKVDNKYYIYGTQQGAATTSNLIDWTALDFSQNPTKTMYTDDLETIFTNTSSGYNVDAYFRAYGQPNGQKWEAAGNLWAPDIIYNPDMGKYCMYLSLNGRVWNTAVVLLTSDTIDGPFEYVGPVIFSGFTDGNVATTGDASTNNTNVESARYTNTDLKKVLEKCPSTINNKDSDGDGLPDRYDGKIVNVKGVEDRANTYGTYLPHAIDPAVFYDEAGTLWMTYGSWSGGIYILKLNGKTGLRDYEQSYDLTYSNSSNAGTITSDPYFGKKIAGGFYVSGEGPYIEKIGNYYYLFMSYGFYDPTGGYEMRIFRSENPDGPYTDSNNVSAIYSKYEMNYGPTAVTNRGEKLMGNYQWDTMEIAEIAQGHNSAFVDDDGRAYVIYHTKFNDGTYGHTVRVHELFLNEDNWLVAAPYEFSGETAVGKTANYTKGSNNKYTMTTADYKKTSWSNDDVAGDYQLLIHKYKVDHAKYEVVKPTNMKLNTDGTITGDVSGSWAWSSKGQPYIAITLDNAVYKGILTNQIIDGTNINTLCFTALNSSSGVNIWGSKIPSDDSVVAYSKHNEKIVMPSTTNKNLTLYTDGMFGAKISWSSSNKDILSDSGKVFPKESNKNVVLTKTITKGTASYQQDYNILIYGTKEETTDKLMTYNSVRSGNVFMPISSLNANTGVSFTFTVTGYDSDWTKVFTTANGESIYLSVLNYGGSNLFEVSGTLSDEAKNAGIVNPWEIFTDRQEHKVKISYNVDGSIEFYRDGKLMLTYAATTAIGENKVSDLAKAIVNAVKIGGITVEYPMKDLSIGFANDYDPNYNPTAGYLYYEDYSDVTNNNIGNLWISSNAQSNVTVDNDSMHGNYFHFTTGLDAGNRGAYCNFFTSGENINGNYVIELDTQLQSGNIANRSASQFVITGNDSTWDINSGIKSKYILKLDTQTVTSNSLTQIWYINDTQEKVIIPYDAWVHIKVKVNTKNKTIDLIITNNDTVLYNETVAMTSETGLKGLYVLRGRGTGFTKVDNIKVKESRETIATYGKDNGDGTYTTGEWYDYTKYYSQILSENSEIKINFHNWSAGTNNAFNYAIAITPIDSTAGIWESGGKQWHLRADRFNCSTFETFYNAFYPTYEVEWDWDTFAKMMSDSEIELTVKRSKNIITINATITGSDKNIYHYMVTTEAAPENGDLTLYLGGEECYLEIYDVEICYSKRR